MHYVTFLALAILQVLAVIHAIKREYTMQYILTICLFPVAGPIVHFVLDVMPRLKHKLNIKKHFMSLKPKSKPKLKDQLSELEEQVRMMPSYENTYQLILCLLSLREPQQAIVYIQRLQDGLYKDCPNLMMLLAKAQLGMAQKELAFETIKDVIDSTTKPTDEVRLLFAKILEANHHYFAAVDEYQRILDNSYSMEAHYHYIRLLNRLNRASEVKNEVATLVKRYKQLSKPHKLMNKKWVVLTHQLH